MRRVVGVGAVALTCALLAGCGGNLMESVENALPDREPEYKSSKRLPPLEVPPDLSSEQLNDSMVVPSVGGGAGTATYSAYANNDPAAGTIRSVSVLPESTEMRVERSGDERWLVVSTSAEQVWPQVRDFWLNQGFILELEDPSIGIMETDWAEERAAFQSGFFRQMMSKLSNALYGAATRDKFRTRLERGSDSSTTEIYVSHRGAEEVRVVTDQREGIAARSWQPRPSDPELEAEILNRMMVQFGASEERAASVMAKADRDRPERARMVRGQEGSALALDEDFSRAWRRTGLALDRVGFTVEDRDRSRGLYFVRYVDPDKDLGNPDDENFLSKLKFWGKDEKPEDNEYLISLNGNDDQTQLVILSKGGEREVSPTADRILSLLHEQLK
jgi:outer membrane protein assembly factor BamC